MEGITLYSIKSSIVSQRFSIASETASGCGNGSLGIIKLLTISRGKSTPCQIAPAANNTAFFSTRSTLFAYLAAVNFIHWSFSLPPSTKGLQRNPQLHRRPFPKVRYSSHCILLHKPKGQLTTSRITPLTRNFATVTSERCHIFIILYLCIGMLPDEPSIGTEPNFSSFK